MISVNRWPLMDDIIKKRGLDGIEIGTSRLRCDHVELGPELQSLLRVKEDLS